MNQPLQHSIQAAVSVDVSTVSQPGAVQPSRLICLAEETPVAFRYGGFAHAVMMATPHDLQDFALGFTRSEGIIESLADLRNVTIHNGEDGITLDISLSGQSLHRYL